MLVRVFSVIWTVCIVSITVTVAVWVLTKPHPYAPFGKFPSPQFVVDKRPFYRPGGILKVKAVKCYNGVGLIPFAGVSYWVEISPTRRVVPNKQTGGVRDPRQGDRDGCFTSFYNNHIPDSLTDGVWRLEGQERSTRGSEVAAVGWYTDEFVIRRTR